MTDPTGQMAPPAPALSCITTMFNEGALIRCSLDSMLAQSFTDFEILLVDDGASEETRQVAQGYDDPRIRHIRQANDGLSSARNRALSLNRARYVSFLDGDDQRPAWAFAQIAALLEEKPDLVLCKGYLKEIRDELRDFYDADVFDRILAASAGARVVTRSHPAFDRILGYALLVEPQSANKVVSADLLRRSGAHFPAGLFFEDMLFHMLVVCSSESIAFNTAPSFVYYRRYGRPQITATSGQTRFDAISVAATVFELFQHTRHFHKPFVRACLVYAMFKLVHWCEDTVSHADRYHYRQAVVAMWRQAHPLLKSAVQTPEAAQIRDEFHWARNLQGYLNQL